MTERPKSDKAPKAIGGASAPAWVGAALLAAAGVFSSWLSYREGVVVGAQNVQAIEARAGELTVRVHTLELRERANHDLIIKITANLHEH